MTAWLLFLKALALVESGGNPQAIGDGGDSWGMYQLQAAYVQDAAQFAGENWTHEDAFNPVLARKIVRAYMARYATKKRLGREPTYELVSRIHNGGPMGFRKSVTDGYWLKVKKELAKRGIFSSN